jgi:hypothetical protein
MKIHWVKYDFGNRIRYCDSMLNRKQDDTTDYKRKITCKRCLRKLKEESALK